MSEKWKHFNKRKKQYSIIAVTGIIVILSVLLVFLIYSDKKGIEPVTNAVKTTNSTTIVPKPTEEPTTTMDFSELKSINSEVFAYINIPGTNIDYPIIYDENEYYLNRTIEGEYDYHGTLFVQHYNTNTFKDKNTIIYGHNMKNGSMFGSLKEYRNASYLVEHPMVYIDLEDGTHAYEIFSCYETSANSNTYTIGFASQPDGRYEQFVHTLKNSSAYDTGIEVSKNDRVITLSTCTKRSENRFVVHAKRIY